jgi:transposase-like protein
MSKYSIEQKDQAIKSALRTTSISLAASELNIPISTLHDWVREYRLLNPSKPISMQSDTKKELAKKDKEIKKLKEELEILKKFEAFSAKRRR